MSALRRLPSTLLISLAACCLACDHTSPLAPDSPMDGLTLQADRTVVPQELPFHGSTVGALVGMMPAPEGRCPPERPVLLLYQGAGTATHLGKFTVAGSECALFDPSNPGTLMSGEGQFTFTAANGDQLVLGYDRTSLAFESPTSPRVFWSAPIHAMGGTGRFTNAVLVDVTWSGGANLLTYESWSSFDGWIRFDASDRAGK